MAHIFQKADKIADTALGILQRQILLPSLFPERRGITDFKGAKGDVVNIKRPAILKARDAGFRSRNALVMDDLITSRIAVKLTEYPLSGVQLSDEEMTLDVEDFAQEVTAPQSAAIARYFEDGIAKTLKGATYVHTVDFNGLVDDPRKVAIQARKKLNTSEVPAAGRYWLVGADVSAAIASFGKLLDVDSSGLPEAVREGVVGRLAGFTIVESNALAPTDSYFVHSSALALAYVTPVAPKGATSAAVAAEGGLAVRQLFDYDATALADRSILSVFTGGAVVTDPKLKSDGTVQVTGGEVVMEFIRAVKVNYSEVEPPAEGNGG